MLYDIVSYHVISCDIILYHIIFCYILFYYIIPYYIILYYDILYCFLGAASKSNWHALFTGEKLGLRWYVN